MGFSLAFYTFRDGNTVDGRCAPPADFLARRGLLIEDGSLLTAAGLPLKPTDLTIDGWHSDVPLSGGIGHATPRKSESRFLLAPCVVADRAIVNPQGTPMFISPPTTTESQTSPRTAKKSPSRLTLPSACVLHCPATSAPSANI